MLPDTHAAHTSHSCSMTDQAFQNSGQIVDGSRSRAPWTQGLVLCLSGFTPTSKEFYRKCCSLLGIRCASVRVVTIHDVHIFGLCAMSML